jgi:hypothetical protein
MPQIKKTIVLKDYRDRNGDVKSSFMVHKITNSVQYGVGNFMSVSEADRLCKDANWTVKIEHR